LEKIDDIHYSQAAAIKKLDIYKQGSAIEWPSLAGKPTTLT
jgi:hypothetical protein